MKQQGKEQSMKHRKEKCLLLGISIVWFLGMTGCSGSFTSPLMEITIEPYEKVVYNTADVVKGDIHPELRLKLVTDEFRRVNYYPVHDEMEVDQVYVQDGDIVTKGDLLVTFKSADIEEQLTTYRNELEENKLLIKHYKKLMKIDKNQDYSQDIISLEEDAEVIEMRIHELTKKLENYHIKAEGLGVVSNVSDMLAYGVVGVQDMLMNVTYGSGDYYVSTEDDYAFQIGDIYEASFGVAVYQMELKEISENTTGERELRFAMAEGEKVITDQKSLDMVIRKTVMKNVLYVPKKAVFKNDVETYVYLMDGDGYRKAVPVTIGATVDGVTVITTGVKEGDKVVVDK